MLDTEQEAKWTDLKNNTIFVFATGKAQTLLRGVELLGLPHAKLHNPEAPGTKHYQREPDHSNPLPVVKFKLERVSQLLPEHMSKEEKEKSYTYLASDVIFSTLRSDGQHIKEIFHKPTRETQGRYGLDHEKIKQELTARYSKDFLARWKLGMGAVGTIAKGRRTSIGVVTIQAEFASLTPTEVEEFYLPESNAGVDMVGIGIGRGINFWLFLSPDSAPIICETPELRELVYRLIVAKVPTEAMILALVESEIEAHPEPYSLLAFSAAHLLSQVQ